MAIKKSIELTVISAKDLKRVTLGHQACYAVAYIQPSKMLGTVVDEEGGLNPTWDCKLTLTCNESLLQDSGSAITVQIFTHGFFKNRLVGTVSIPLSAVANDLAKDQSTSMLLQVKRPSGRTQGVLNVSVKFGDNGTGSNRNSRASSRANSRATSPINVPSISPSSSRDYNKPQGYGGNLKGEEPVLGYPVTSTGYPAAYTQQSDQPQQSNQPQQSYQHLNQPQYTAQYRPQEQYQPGQYSSEQGFFSRRQVAGNGTNVPVGAIGGFIGALLIGDLLT